VSRLTAGGPHYYTLRPDSTVGGEVYERELLTRLPDHGIDLELGLPRGHAWPRHDLAAAGNRVAAGRHDLAAAGNRVAAGRHDLAGRVRVTVLRHRLGLHWLLAPLVFTPYVVRLLRGRRVDLLRGHSVRHTGPALLLGRLLARRRVPVVLHHHHLYPRWARLEAAIARRADAIVTVSEHSRDELVARGVPAERVHVVLEGVDTHPPTGGWPEAWPGDGLRLLYVGRLEERKRPDLAVAALRAAGVPASLVIAGEGPLAAALGGDGVRLVGRVSDEDKWRLYDSADLLLFGSTLEGFGLVVAEAQSRGVPVIAAAGTATREALADGESGLLAPPTADAFGAAIRELADDDRRAAMSARARAVARRFDWDACAAGVAAVYRGLA
jgi:glycosyltransferase involved in cell wall biosynthesis